MRFALGARGFRRVWQRFGMPIASLRPWAPEHLFLLVEANTAAMTRYPGGPENDDEVRRRHSRYLRLCADDAVCMFAIEADGGSAGGIGFWPIEHDGAGSYETGWNVLSRWQGHGIARQALRALIHIVSERAPHATPLLAYP